MIASLPMYARPELIGAHAAFWALIRDGLRNRGLPAPEALDQTIGVWDAWTHPQLVLSQTCNLPFRARLHGTVTLIGAGDYGLPDAGPGLYYSVFVARRSDADTVPEAYAQRRFAYNEGLSQSGWAAPQAWAKARGFAFAPSLQTGAHAQSARAVAEGRADIAALDAVTWRLLQQHDPVAQALRVIGRTEQSPALSFITRAGQDPAPYRDAMTQALQALAPDHAAALGLRAIVAIPEAAYLAIPLPQPPSI